MSKFNLGNESYESWLFAECAAAAYKGKVAGKNAFKKLGFTSYKLMDLLGAQAVCASNPEFVVIAFRGTEPSQMSDVKADLDFWPKPQKNGEGKVHNGFAYEVDKIEQDIADYLKRHKGKPLYVCGHSLGGAMATIWTQRNEPIVTGLFTYGSPRVGDAVFRDKLHVKHVRVVNNNDVVASIPPAVFFRHTGNIKYIASDGKVMKDYSWWKDFKDMWAGLWDAWSQFKLFDGIADHNITKYAKNLKKNIEE